MDASPNNESVIFFNGGQLTCKPSWVRNLHSHSFFQLIIIYKGEMMVSIQGEEFKAKPGDIVFYPCNLPHQESNNKDTDLEIIYLDWKGPAISFPTLLYDRKGRVRIMAEWLLSDFKNSLHPNQDRAENNLMQTLLYELERNISEEEDVFVQEVKSLIHESLSRKISLESLAAVFDMNKYTFLRKYKHLTGITPLEAVKRIRIERARDMIISSDLSLREIAVICGMSNEYNLSRVFQKTLKTPPGYFRRNH
ncbi:MAG: helix-turn-helix transcriptional regulator [Bacteroidetes bacterium]|nr:helix-turn-helix transcriptional regulator [Bacteroidota bacterium]